MSWFSDDVIISQVLYLLIFSVGFSKSSFKSPNMINGFNKTKFQNP